MPKIYICSPVFIMEMEHDSFGIFLLTEGRLYPRIEEEDKCPPSQPETGTVIVFGAIV